VNYYQHHIGDFRAGTFTMDRLERWLYRDMMDMYYDSEKPLPLDHDELFYTLGTTVEQERTAVERLLKFKFKKTTEGYRHERCDSEILAFHAKGEKASAAGKASAAIRATKKPTDVEPDSNGRSTSAQRPSTNHKPLTNNHKPLKNTTSASPPGDYPPEFEEAWAAYPPRPGASKKDSCKAWAARCKDGASPADLLAGVQRYANYVLFSRIEPQYTKQPATFFGPGEHYKADWAVTGGTPQKGQQHGNFDKQDYSKGVGPDGQF
jgi:uncharacterized protein YdaU (DUF1376 family)